MGRERSGPGQCFYLCAAGLIITMLTACVPVEVKTTVEENVVQQREQHLLTQGDFEGALRANREMLALFPHSPPGDTALFNLGLIYVHYANPERDVGKTMYYFSRLKTEFPDSPRTEEAMIWGNILEALESTRQKEREIQEKMKEKPAEPGNVRLRHGQHLLAQGDFQGALQANREVLDQFPRSAPGDVALFNMGLIHIHHTNPKKDIGQAQNYFSRLLKEFPDSPRAEETRVWIGILETLEKTRRIDIAIEGKKRELRR
jgi:TolA-binding protein